MHRYIEEWDGQDAPAYSLWSYSNRPYLSFAESSHSDETFVVIYWHYARNDGAGYANLTAVIHKLEKDISVIEKLCNYKVSTSINL